jgi:hypothetical protein
LERIRVEGCSETQVAPEDLTNVPCPKCMIEGRKTSTQGTIVLRNNRYCVVCHFILKPEDKHDALAERARRANETRKNALSKEALFA